MISLNIIKLCNNLKINTYYIFYSLPLYAIINYKLINKPNRNGEYKMYKSINELSFTLSEVKETWTYKEDHNCYEIEVDVYGFISILEYHPVSEEVYIYYMVDTTLETNLEKFSSNPDSNEHIIDDLVMEQCDTEGVFI